MNKPVKSEYLEGVHQIDYASALSGYYSDLESYCSNLENYFISKDRILYEIEMFDSLVEFPHGNEHCILPEHYEQLAESIVISLKQKDND